MNKKIIAALLLLTIWVPVNAQAALKNQTQPTPTLAIVDTAIDTSLPIFNGKIVAEVCIMDWSLCPNQSSFMEGVGAASLPSHQISLDGFDHGTQMASAAVMSNPNMNIVFIRIFGFDPTLKGQVRNGGLCNKPAGSAYRCVNTNEVIAKALATGNSNLEAVYKQTAFDRIFEQSLTTSQVKAKKAEEEKAIVQSKRDAAVVSKGASAKSADVSSKPVTTLREAFELAKRQING